VYLQSQILEGRQLSQLLECPGLFFGEAACRLLVEPTLDAVSVLAA
jgi:hypothetical protein